MCKKENLKAAIYQRSKAILSQCEYLRMIVKKAETLDATQSDTTEKQPTKVTKNRKETTTGATLVPTATAKVAAPAV